MNISVIILTYNEEPNLPFCLESVKLLDCEVFVLDSGSTDRTKEIATTAGAQVVVHKFETQAQQLNWGLENLPFQGKWILRLDADERVTPELAQELSSDLMGLSTEVTGLYLKRRVYFMGRWMRHGGYYPIWLMRVWRKGCAVSEMREMNEHMILLRGRAGFLRHDVVDENHKNLSSWVERQNKYSTRHAKTILQGPVEQEVSPSLFGTPEARRRWLLQNAYLRFPLFFRAFLFFIWRYFFRLGFLDGKEGLIFHFLHGCWHRFMTDAKIFEIQHRK